MGHGKGAFKNKRLRAFSRPEFTVQQTSVGRSDSSRQGLRGSKALPWKDIPLSNFELMDWIKYLKIPNFKGIFSRDSKDHLHRNGCCIINLDDLKNQGTHWVSHDIKGKTILYFDSFSMPPPVEFVEYAEKIGKEII